MNPHNPIVIVGAGQAGMKAAEELRLKGYQDDLILIGEEPHAPYQRPPLSKAFLKRDISADRLMLKADDFYELQKIEPRFGERVTAIDPQAGKVSLASGGEIGYSRLLLTTGTRARSLPLEGVGLERVYSLRTLGDVERIASELTAGMKLVIIGAGYIGLEVAASMRALGLEVSVIETADRVLKRVVAPDMSAFFETLHRHNGVEIRTATLPRRICGVDRVSAVELDDGEMMACDAVLIAIGAEPVSELASAAGLAVHNGIVVDEATRTAAGNIFAAGDCAVFPSRRYGRTIRLESVQNAIDQARAAAQAMLGERVVYDPVPWFWSDQYDVKLQIAGLSQNYEETRIEGDPASGSFALTYLAGGRAICVDAVNQPRAHMLARRSLAREGV